MLQRILLCGMLNMQLDWLIHGLPSRCAQASACARQHEKSLTMRPSTEEAAVLISHCPSGICSVSRRAETGIDAYNQGNARMHCGGKGTLHPGNAHPSLAPIRAVSCTNAAAWPLASKDGSHTTTGNVIQGLFSLVCSFRGSTMKRYSSAYTTHLAG